MREALKQLAKDKRLAPLIKKYGEPDLKRGKNPFQALVRSIIYQQLSGKAAATIHARFLALFNGKKFPAPEEVRAVRAAKLRSVGLSAQKAAYLHDLSEKFSDGTIEVKKFRKMSNEEIVEHLVAVKGIGEWSVHMFLMFTLNRLDVLPTGDLGIRKGFQIVYRLKDLPSKAEMEKLAKPWRGYATVASWYLWRAADEAKALLTKTK